MLVNVERVKAERQKRAWSQEQLASAAGLGLRTVQRIESSGVASNETVKCLAAVFECGIQDIVTADVPKHRSWFSNRAVTFGAIASCALVLAFFLVAGATAGEVMLDVVLGGADLDVKVFKLVTEQGQQTEARLDQQLRIVLTPTVQQNDLILVSAEIYAYQKNGFMLLSKPKVLTRNGVDAKFEIGLDDGRQYQVNITPHLM